MTDELKPGDRMSGQPGWNEAVEAAALAYYNEIDSHALDGISGGWGKADDVERGMYYDIATTHLSAAYSVIAAAVLAEVEKRIKTHGKMMVAFTGDHADEDAYLDSAHIVTVLRAEVTE